MNPVVSYRLALIEDLQPSYSMTTKLTIANLKSEATVFAESESQHHESSIFGVTDGKAIGTYTEHKFRAHLQVNYTFEAGSSASGIDFPELGVDMKVTRSTQPQSSCPFRNARQKIYGLGYHLLVFVYEKTDDEQLQTGRLDFQHVIFVHRETTADYQTTRGILEIIDRDGNEDDLIAFINDRNLPVDEIGAQALAQEIINDPPRQGYLTISNALQWRLQFGHVIRQADSAEGIERLT